jgi:magnesium transporter
MPAMIVDSAIYVDGHRAAEPASLDETYEACRSEEAVAWIGLYKPTAEEFESVVQEFELHPLAVEDALDAHQRPKLERYGGTLFVVLKPARYLDEVERVEFGEIHIFLGENFVITVRHSESPDVGMVRQSLEADPERSSGGGTRLSCTPSWTGSWTTTGPWWTAPRTTSRR